MGICDYIASKANFDLGFFSFKKGELEEFQSIFTELYLVCLGYEDAPSTERITYYSFKLLPLGADATESAIFHFENRRKMPSLVDYLIVAKRFKHTRDEQIKFGLKENKD